MRCVAGLEAEAGSSSVAHHVSLSMNQAITGQPDKKVTCDYNSCSIFQRPHLQPLWNESFHHPGLI